MIKRREIPPVCLARSDPSLIDLIFAWPSEKCNLFMMFAPIELRFLAARC